MAKITRVIVIECDEDQMVEHMARSHFNREGVTGGKGTSMASIEYEGIADVDAFNKRVEAKMEELYIRPSRVRP